MSRFLIRHLTVIQCVVQQDTDELVACAASSGCYAVDAVDGILAQAHRESLIAIFTKQILSDNQFVIIHIGSIPLQSTMQ